MRWLEFIKVRTVSVEERTNATELFNSITAELRDPDLALSGLCTHASNPDDLAILLVWNTDRPKMRGSALGLNLTEEFRRSGLVDHSVWIVG